jgi:uncharacterized protein with HEPN domain
MTPASLRVADYLNHILEAIRRVREYTQGLSEQDFYSNHLIQDAVIRNFEIMGEAARNAERRGKDSLELRDKLKLFREVYWMRNVLTHTGISGSIYRSCGTPYRMTSASWNKKFKRFSTD